jgi:uncharacterized protein
MPPRHAKAPQIGVVVVQPTPFCNINCSYCYLPDRNVKSVMAESTVRSLFEKVFASGWAADDLTIIWHAGEPLVVPVSFYESAFELVESLRPQSVRLRHSIQTNGMLISTEWCELFKKWQVGLGVSIDGPRRFNDEHRVSRTGRSTFDRTLAGIRMLRREQVPFHVISVLSEKSLEAPEEMLEFYLTEGVEDVCFNVEESEGEHVSGLFASDDPQSHFRVFLRRFWELSRQSEGIRFIREIDGMLPRVFRIETEELKNVQVEPFGMLNIDCYGNASSFSPELLGMKNERYGNFIIGNVNRDSLEDMQRSAAMLAMTGDIAAGVQACRQSCEYFSVCGGGAPINKLTENGSFASARTSFCSLTQMVPTDLILDAFDRLKHDVAVDDLAEISRLLRRGAASNLSAKVI